MNQIQRRTGNISYAPCPPEEFCGRYEERERLRSLLPRAEEHGQAVMISGPPGIGKSSLLNWLAYDLQDRPGGSRSLVIRAEIFEPPRMIFSAFRKLLYDLQLHAVSGWFRSPFGIEYVKEAARYANDLLEKYAAPVEPVGLLPKTGEEIIGVFAQAPEVEYDRVREGFWELLQALGSLMADSGRIAVVLLDDAHLASRPDRRLLKDIIHDLPPGVLLAFCRRRYEWPMNGMFRSFSPGCRAMNRRWRKRFGLSPDDTAAAFLERPPATRQSYGLFVPCASGARTTEVLEELLAGEWDPAEIAFDALPEIWQAWAEMLSVLNPPFPVPVMACMLSSPGPALVPITDNLQESPIFIRLPGGGYAFAHHFLQEYSLKRLSADTKMALNAMAVECFEQSMHLIPVRLHALLSLAGHHFNAQDYEKAADLNLELALRFYNREDYDTALILTRQAIVSAEHMGDDTLLAAAKRQRDLIQQKMSDPAGTAQWKVACLR